MSTPYQLVVSEKSESESESEVKKVMGFWSFNFFETLICFRGVFNLKQHMSKKVHNNFLMGLKIW